MMWHRLAAVWFVLPATAMAQGRCELQVQGALHGVRVFGRADYAATGASLRTELAAGTWQLRFPAGGGGRPSPIAVDAPAGGRVFVAIGRAPRPDEVPDELAATLREGRTFDRGDERSARVHVRMRQLGGGSGRPCGLVARWQDAQHHYRFVRDAAMRELRLERQLGPAVEVLQRVAVPAPDDQWHDLELEVDGFRLLALFDGEPVARALDGALSHGGCGTFMDAGGDVEFAQLTVAPPAVPLSTVAVVARDQRAEVFAIAPTHAGGVFALLLALDRPTALWPTDEHGFEVPLLQQPAEPVFLFDLHSGSIGDDGAIRGAFTWPNAVALRLQATLVGGYVGSPDASVLRGRLPWAAVRF